VNDIILIAGMPASGKTSFGDYLRDKKHFLHVDLEAFDGSYFHSVWNASLSVGRLEVFLETLKWHATRAVLTWGFHTNNLGIVRALKAAGVVLWWFDGDEAAARERFIARGYGSPDDFEAQIKRINDNRGKIEELFRPNILTTLQPDKSSMTFSQIFEALLGRR
jgi:hypothetical protein